MLNHVRTLLLNRDTAGRPGAAFPGEEAVPDGYKAVVLPTALQRVRQILFGQDPDRAMLNYRLRQLMPLLHATPLEAHVLALDPRVTYVDRGRTDLFDAATFVPAVQQFLGDSAPLYLQGDPRAPDGTGRVRHQYQVAVVGPDTAEVLQQTPPRTTTAHFFTLADGISDTIPLGDAGYGVRLSTEEAGAQWSVEVFNRPQWDLGQLAAALDQLGEPTLIQLFGLRPDEPYRTFAQLWRRHTELPYRLGGLVLALAYRTDEIRRGQHG